MTAADSKSARRPRPAREPIRSMRGGLALMIGAPLVAAIAAWQLIATLGAGQLQVMFAALILFAGYRGFETGRRMRLPDGWTVMAKDPRPPVVYLRPFSEDDRQVYDSPIGGRHGGVGDGAAAKGKASREDDLADALKSVGPCVAIGKPGDTFAPFGFARVYVGDDAWQETVLDLIRKAAVVILQPDVTAGTWFELQAVHATVNPRRVLMLVPDPTERPLGYNRVRNLTSHVLPVVLPEGHATCDGFAFDAKWTPTPLALRKSSKGALAPFLAQLSGLQTERTAA